jgi:hypothetical protein
MERRKRLRLKPARAIWVIERKHPRAKRWQIDRIDILLPDARRYVADRNGVAGIEYRLVPYLPKS